MHNITQRYSGRKILPISSIGKWIFILKFDKIVLHYSTTASLTRQQQLALTLRLTRRRSCDTNFKIFCQLSPSARIDSTANRHKTIWRVWR